MPAMPAARAPARPDSRHSRRKGGLVTPAMGAKTTGLANRSAPMCSAVTTSPPSRAWLHGPLALRAAQPVGQVVAHPVERDTLLGHGIAVAHGDGLVIEA